MSDELPLRSLAELAALIRTREVSPVEVLQHTLDRIERFDPKINGYITVMADTAREEALAAEREIGSGKYRGSLHGLPISVKDIFATQGVRTTAGSKVLENWIPDHDSMAVERLRAAGAVIIGKTNLHEFSYGVTSDNPYFGPVHNPWNLELVPGGSSGGSGAAVAMSLCAGSVGSDTGGSIRIPCAICNLTGIKPTYGRVSRYGVIPLAWSIDHVGPIAKTVQDAAILLGTLAGHDEKDATSSRQAVPDYLDALTANVRGIRAGVPRQYFFDHIDTEIRTGLEVAMATLEELGVELHPVDTPHMELCAAMEAHITLAEATSYHEPLMQERLEDYGKGVRIDLEAGRYLLATDYVKSQRARTLLQNIFDELFQTVDVIVSPTLPAFPPRIGEVNVQSGDLREHVTDAFLRFNIPFNLTGLPAISVPCGFSSTGLPIGLQVAGRAFDESAILRVAHTYQTHTEWHTRTPPLSEELGQEAKRG